MSEPNRPDLDLLVDPWLPVIGLDGVRREVSLLEALEGAHLLREVADPSPLVAFGVYRFLAAVLQAYLPVASLNEWATVWEGGRFQADFLDRVRRGCHGRLRLFDPTRPFYQAGDIPLDGKPAEGVKTVGYLFLEESTGTNVTHFSHRGDGDHAYCPTCCVRGLLTLPPFAISGGAGIKPSINGTPPIYVLPRGETLFHTLLLNHLAPQFRPDTGRDPGPLWEQEDTVRAKDPRPGIGFVESLTWPPRRVRLFPGTGGACSACGRRAATLVRHMVFMQGRSLAAGRSAWRDPWVAYTLRKPPKGGQPEVDAVRPREERDVWRDFPALFLTRPGGDRQPPQVLAQIVQLLDRELLDPGTRVHFETYALRTDGKAKVFEWRRDHFDFPLVLLGGAATGTVETALERADRVANALTWALRKLHPGEERGWANPEERRKALRSLITYCLRDYWHRLEEFFRRHLSDPRLQGDDASQKDWLDAWDERVRQVGRRVLEDALEAFDADFDGLRRQNEARAVFYGNVKQIFAA
ncbi:MAG TPA: type I-E CRISPR-associated protein Cse1/CasA [Chloroflexota bacterium]